MIYITDTAVVRDDVDAEFEVVKAEVDAVDAEVEAPVTTTGGKHPHHFTAEQRDVPFNKEHVALNHNVVSATANVYPVHVSDDLGARPGVLVK